MGAAVKGDLRFLLADLSAKADAGDEEAATQLLVLMAQCTPEVCRAAADLEVARNTAPPFVPLSPVTLSPEGIAEYGRSLGFEMPDAGPPPALRTSFGEALAAAMNPTGEPDPWAFTEATIELICAHYWIDPEAAWAVFWDVEVEGMDRLLSTPEGVSLLGQHIALNVLGFDDSEAIPPLPVSTH